MRCKTAVQIQPATSSASAYLASSTALPPRSGHSMVIFQALLMKMRYMLFGWSDAHVTRQQGFAETARQPHT